MKRKNIILLGATGSIGDSTLDLVDSYPDLFKIVGISANNNFEKVLELSKKYKPTKIVFADPKIQNIIEKNHFNSNTEILFGEEGLFSILEMDVDLVVNGISGFAGLLPSLRTIELGINIALANKEPIVSAGNILLNKAKISGSKILPVDSEHNALFQILSNYKKRDIEAIVLTASGGPFREDELVQLCKRSPKEALNHPKWNMGPKNSIDSATMMNKALEVIEASVLFNIPSSKINVLIHPEAIIHGMVSLIDGGLLSYMSEPDMRVPIFNALTWPDRKKHFLKFPKLKQLNFSPVRNDIFPSIKMARKALNKGFIATTLFNAANEIAVSEFLNKNISFCDIFRIVQSVLKQSKDGNPNTIKEVFEFDKIGRNLAIDYINKKVKQ